MSKRRKRPTGLPAFIGQQVYKQLRNECIKKKQKFVDLAFPPENSSLFLDPERSSEIVWKRPGVSLVFCKPKITVFLNALFFYVLEKRGHQKHERILLMFLINLNFVFSSLNFGFFLLFW